eukprot:766006-Hanusia_phi.AAC.1
MAVVTVRLETCHDTFKRTQPALKFGSAACRAAVQYLIINFIIKSGAGTPSPWHFRRVKLSFTGIRGPRLAAESSGILPAGDAEVCLTAGLMTLM